MARQYQDIIVTNDPENPNADEMWDAFYSRAMNIAVEFSGYEADEPGSIFRFEATVLELSEEPQGPSMLRVTLDVPLKGKYEGVYDASHHHQSTLKPA